MEDYTYTYHVQELKRGSWKTIRSTQDLNSAVELADQRALRTLEFVRVVKEEVSLIKTFLYAR